MIIEGFMWFSDIVDKIETKHGVTTSEAENIFTRKALFNRIKKGNVRGEDLYPVK